MVAPVTDEERAALAAFLGGEAAARDWGRQGWARAALAMRDCPAGVDKTSKSGQP